MPKRETKKKNRIATKTFKKHNVEFVLCDEDKGHFDLYKDGKIVIKYWSTTGSLYNVRAKTNQKNCDPLTCAKIYNELENVKKETKQIEKGEEKVTNSKEESFNEQGVLMPKKRIEIEKRLKAEREQERIAKMKAKEEAKKQVMPETTVEVVAEEKPIKDITQNQVAKADNVAPRDYATALALKKRIEKMAKESEVQSERKDINIFTFLTRNTEAETLKKVLDIIDELMF